jgi:hypothetical protein
MLNQFETEKVQYLDPNRKFWTVAALLISKVSFRKGVQVGKLNFLIKIDLLFIVLRPSQEYFTTWRCHYCWWRDARFRSMLSVQSLWAGMDLYRATPDVTRGLGFSSLIRRTAPFSRLMFIERILVRIFKTNIFSSPELKAQVSFSDRPLSGVRLSVCKLLHFRLLLQNHWTNFNQTWHKSSLGEGD